MNFMFELGDAVTLIVSGETGKVIGRAQYDNMDDAYLIRYKTADGRATEQWWTQSALTR